MFLSFCDDCNAPMFMFVIGALMHYKYTYANDDDDDDDDTLLRIIVTSSLVGSIDATVPRLKVYPHRMQCVVLRRHAVRRCGAARGCTAPHPVRMNVND